MKLPENAEAALGMCILAASQQRKISEVADEMVRIRETLDPQPERSAKLREPYLRMVAELEKRGWLPSAVAAHARHLGSRATSV